MKKGRLLWVDDEIELLRSHIVFLIEKGYEVETATNGMDAIEIVQSKNIDLIFLDEMMSGMGGLETLAKIKEINQNIPIVMVTKNEEESLMNEAIGNKINDYLLKPVNPSQVLLVCKKFLESKDISAATVSKGYMQDFNEISRIDLSELNYDDWIEMYIKMVNWDLQFESLTELDYHQTFNEMKRELNKMFSKYIENNYLDWIHSDKERPMLSPNVFADSVVPLLREDKKVFFFVLDCMRYDQWLVMEEFLYPSFKISKKFYYSILPTATPYARNSLFAGIYPMEIEKYYGELWTHGTDDENSHNKYEKELLQKLLEKYRLRLPIEPKYFKILEAEYGRNFEQNILSLINNPLVAVVVNFLDMIAHSRTDSAILKEIAPNESAYRSLTKSWFMHSSLLRTIKNLAGQKNVRIVITTDHGSIRSLRAAKVLGDKDALPNLRYKFGRNLKCDEKQAIFIRNPIDYKLPKRGITVNYLIAKEDYYFVYPTDYNKYLNMYKDTFQHGGISLEEMILPVITLEPKF